MGEEKGNCKEERQYSDHCHTGTQAKPSPRNGTGKQKRSKRKRRKEEDWRFSVFLLDVPENQSRTVDTRVELNKTRLQEPNQNQNKNQNHSQKKNQIPEHLVPLASSNGDRQPGPRKKKQERKR